MLNVRVSQPSQGWTVDMATRLSQLKPSPLHCVSPPADWNRTRTHSPSKESWSDHNRLPARFRGRFAQLRMELEDGGSWVRGGSQNVSVSLFGVLRSMWTTQIGSVSHVLKYCHLYCSDRSLTHEPHQPAWPKHRPCSQWVATNKVRLLLLLPNAQLAPCKPPFCSSLVITQNTVIGLQCEGYCLWVQINVETLSSFWHLMQMSLISVRLRLPLFNTPILALDSPLSWCGCVSVYIHVCMGRAHSAYCTCDRHKITSGVGL